MTQLSTEYEKRTNVRVFIAVLAALLVTGCGTVAPRATVLQPTRTAGPALCERFGPEMRCGHPDSSRVSRALDRLDQSARLGFRGW